MKKMINKILCPTDGSKASAKSIEFACDFANFVDAELVFIDIERATDKELSSGYRQGYNHEILEAIAEQNYKVLYLAEKTAKERGVKNSSFVTAQGLNVAATIIDYAESNGCDHVVMGSTGKTGIARLLLGSVASDVVSKAHCPVTIVR